MRSPASAWCGVLWCALLVLALPCAAQEAPSVRELLTGGNGEAAATPATAATPAQAVDRETPRTAVIGFMAEAAAANWVGAARYLELPSGIEAEQTLQLPPRDTTQSEKAAESLAEDIAAGRELRLQAGRHDDRVGSYPG